MPHDGRTCINCGKPIAWQPAECAECRGFAFKRTRDLEVDLSVKTTVNLDTVILLRARGLSWLEISFELSCPKTTLIQAARRIGLVTSNTAGYQRRGGLRSSEGHGHEGVFDA